METFVCYWLNGLLRNESWEEMNMLTPYLVCLTYTFQLQDFIIKHEKPKGLLNKFKKVVTRRQKLTLFRGTAPSEELLVDYRFVQNKYFSWNGVTSTSRSKKQTIKFIHHSLKRAEANANSPTKVGILFKIKTDFYSPKDCEGLIDISGYSEYPQEKEIILSPGIVFKLISIRLNPQSNIYKVKLKLRKKFEESQDDVPLLGVLSDKVISEDKAILDRLSQDELIKAVQLLEDNQMIKKL